MLKYLRGKIELKKEGDGITVIMSDETLDRHGDVLPIDQWDLTKFLLSPRMLVDHNHEVSSIVGRWENTRIEGNKLMADAKFHNFTELAVAVKKMVENDFLDTVSVGFIPKGPTEDGGKESFELIETSWVTVPANPSARTVKDLLSKQTPEEQVAKVKTFIGEKDEEAEPVSENDEAEEIKEVISSVEQFKEISDNTEVVACTYTFISGLVADREALTKLTSDETKKVEASKRAHLLKRALREVAKGVNESLRELKGVQ